MSQRFETIESIYNTYSPMLYGIALEISPSDKQAERILILTFQKIQERRLIEENGGAICAILIKVLIQTACEYLKATKKFKLKAFENMPLLQKLLCEEINIQDHCIENNITQKEAAQQIRIEFNLLKNFNKESKFDTGLFKNENYSEQDPLLLSVIKA